MTFKDLQDELAQFENKITELWEPCYMQAKKECRGNWQDPSVMKRWRERAYEIADQKLADTRVSVKWEAA